MSSSVARTKQSSTKASSRRPGDGSSKAAQSKAKSGSKTSRAQSIPEVGPVIVRDENGNDVTPRSLLPTAATAMAISATSGPAPHDASSASESFVGESVDKSEGGPTGLGSDSEAEESAASDAEVERHKQDTPRVETQAESADAVAVLTEAQLEEMVHLELTETETFFLISMPGMCVAADAADADAVKGANARYDELLERRTTMADM